MSARAWYGMLVSMVRSNLTIHAIIFRQSPVHRPLLLMKPEVVPMRSLRKSFRGAMICAVVGLLISSTRLSADPAAPASMSPNLIEHMQLRTVGQRGVVAQRQQMLAGWRVGVGMAGGWRRAAAGSGGPGGL